MDEEEVFDSPTGWIAAHIREYVATDGAQGHCWRGVYTLLLTTRGKRSGKRRRTALIYGRDGDCYVVVGSVGGRRSTRRGTTTFAPTGGRAAGRR